MKGSVLIGQSGGPTSVINASLQGIIEEAFKNPFVTNVYGALNGIDGILHHQIIDFKFDGVIAASVLAFAFFALRFIVSFCLKKEAMGPADIFIAGVIGAILGLRLGFASIFVAAILTLPAYAIVNKKGYELPFVPFLALGMLIVFCAKTETIWILNYIGGANV